jgi:quinolinate synthase
MQKSTANLRPLSRSPQELYELLKNVKEANPYVDYSLDKCLSLFPLIQAIQQLKEEKDAIILAHSYVHPDIIYTVADHTGDSFGLSLIAKESSHSTIVFPSVRFMAETAKILNPHKTVIDPNTNGGCSLAESIDAATVRQFKQKHPHHTFVCYINTTAAVKAECDVCVTSSNVYHIIENIPNDKIFFLPDTLMGKNIQEYVKEHKVQKQIDIFEAGSCYVHEGFHTSEVLQLKKKHPDLKILAHPECSPSVVSQAEMVASTTGLMDHIIRTAKKEDTFLLLTECGISSRLKVERPDIRLVGTCMMCKYMKSNHLSNIKNALANPLPSQIIEIDERIQEKALRCIENMFLLSRC